jgi:hypothetical protein
MARGMHWVEGHMAFTSFGAVEVPGHWALDPRRQHEMDRLEAELSLPDRQDRESRLYYHPSVRIYPPLPPIERKPRKGRAPYVIGSRI